jgi:transposase InsO family protein
VTTARGLGPAMAYYALLDRTPEGRDESDTRPLSVRRHDEYGTSQRDPAPHWSLAQARVVVSDWKADYNHRRRHSALGYQAPAAYAAARTRP